MIALYHERKYRFALPFIGQKNTYGAFLPALNRTSRCLLRQLRGSSYLTSTRKREGIETLSLFLGGGGEIRTPASDLSELTI
jgi:hypothetical protein